MGLGQLIQHKPFWQTKSSFLAIHLCIGTDLVPLVLRPASCVSNLCVRQTSVNMKTEIAGDPARVSPNKQGHLF